MQNYKRFNHWEIFVFEKLCGPAFRRFDHLSAAALPDGVNSLKVVLRSHFKVWRLERVDCYPPAMYHRPFWTFWAFWLLPTSHHRPFWAGSSHWSIQPCPTFGQIRPFVRWASFQWSSPPRHPIQFHIICIIHIVVNLGRVQKRGKVLSCTKPGKSWASRRRKARRKKLTNIKISPSRWST